MGDLKDRSWNRSAASVKFQSGIMKSQYNRPVFASTYGSVLGAKNVARICVGCNEVFPLDACSNCGSEAFVPGISTDKVAGIFCFKCEGGITSWKCPDCQTSNPINKSLGIEEAKGGGCFVATAVCGSYDSPEVEILRDFRDEKLLKTTLGRNFVNIYYAISPRFAAMVSKTASSAEFGLAGC